MKLLFCKNCYDVVKLYEGEDRCCKCGKSGGRYIDCVNAEYWGDSAVPMGFANLSFVEALKNIPDSGIGKDFCAFIIPKDCCAIKKIKK